ncbi:MAG: hypothetical protein LBG15_10945 [Dysgonamonadaceae bacterium]|nr:hypothetical protein [Dysgonamonadaceae bacterium]
MKFIEYLEIKKTDIHLVPGNHTLALVENLSDLLKQRTTIWRTEQGAGYGAFANSILSLSVPTVFVTAGPGITNIVTAVAQAYNEKLPMIVIGVNNWLNTLDKRIGTIHELGRTNYLFEPISLQTISVSSAEQFCLIIDECYSKAKLIGKPIYIDIPSDVLDQIVNFDYEYTNSNYSICFAGEDVLEKCADALLKAKHPVLLCGIGAVQVNCINVIESISNSLEIPIVSTLNAVSFFDSKNHIGTLWDRIFSRSEFGKQSDYILAIGCDMGALDTANGALHINDGLIISTEKVLLPHYNNISVICDLSNFLLRLYEKTKNHDKRNNSWVNILKDERKKQLNKFQEQMNCSTLIWNIQHSYPKETFFCVDVCLEGFAFIHFWDQFHGAKMFASHTYVNLGSSLPVAVGASRLRRKTVCIIGDGGLAYCGFELLTALKYNCANIGLIVFNNGEFGTIAESAKIDKKIYELESPNYAMFAQSIGFKYYSSVGADIKEVIEVAENNGGGYLLEVVRDEKTPLFNLRDWRY